MKTAVVILTLSIASALAQKPSPRAPEPDILGLKPTVVQFAEDGLFLPKLCLQGTKGRVLFSEPKGFTMDEAAPGFRLVSKEDRDTTLHIINSSTLLLPLATEAQRKSVRDSILATAPRDATRVEITSEGEDAFPINGWKTHQFTMSYGLFGQTYKKQVVFVRLHAYQELQFVTHAPEKLAGSVAGALGSILHSWYREPLNVATAKPKD